jgi:hypothetical protein
MNRHEGVLISLINKRVQESDYEVLLSDTRSASSFAPLQSRWMPCL